MGAFVGFVLLKGFYSFWLFGFAYGTGRSILWPWSPIWFLPHLWLVWLAACGVARCVKWSELRLSLRLVLVMVLMILGGFVVQAFSRNMDWWTGLLPFMGLPFSADLLLVDLSYFLLGSVAKEYLLSGRMYSWAFWFVFPVWGSVQLFAGFPINLNAREYGDLFVTPIKVALGVLMIVTLSAAVIRVNSISSLISKVGESSLFILLFHSPIQHLLHKVLTQLGLNPWGSSCIGFLVAIAVPVWLHGIAKRNKPLGRLFFVS